MLLTWSSSVPARYPHGFANWMSSSRRRETKPTSTLQEMPLCIVYEPTEIIKLSISLGAPDSKTLRTLTRKRKDQNIYGLAVDCSGSSESRIHQSQQLKIWQKARHHILECIPLLLHWMTKLMPGANYTAFLPICHWQTANLSHIPAQMLPRNCPS